MDLGDFYTGRLSFRRLLLLIKHLPGTSQVKTISRDRRRTLGIKDPTFPIEQAPPETYSQTEWLLLAIDDDLRSLLWLFQTIYRKEGSRVPPPPDLIPRPGAEPKRRATLNAWFGMARIGPASHN